VISIPKAGWPEVGNYYLVDCLSMNKGEATVLADGADPAYYYREVNAVYAHSKCNSCSGTDDPNMAVDRLRQRLLGGLFFSPQEDPPLKSQVNESIDWRGAEAYLSDVRGFVLHQKQEFVDVARRLQKAGLLTTEEAKTAIPALDVRVIDGRVDKTVPLPSVEKLGERVTVRM
jgi:hypothetical protein